VVKIETVLKTACLTAASPVTMRSLATSVGTTSDAAASRKR
jgi:hypothetical protein